MMVCIYEEASCEHYELVDYTMYKAQIITMVPLRRDGGVLKI